MTIARQLSSPRNSIKRTKAFEAHSTTTTKLSFFVLSFPLASRDAGRPLATCAFKADRRRPTRLAPILIRKSSSNFLGASNGCPQAHLSTSGDPTHRSPRAACTKAHQSLKSVGMDSQVYSGCHCTPMQKRSSSTSMASGTPSVATATRRTPSPSLSTQQ